MMLCKDCVHYEVCKDYVESALDGLQYNDSQMNGDDCEFFKDRSRFVELDKEADSGRVITLDDAIAHCYEVADGADDSMCNGCRAEHMMLAAWLCELKMRREQELQKPPQLAELPRVGDKVYELCRINQFGDYKIDESEIKGFIVDTDGTAFDYELLEKRFFLTREEAEQALKEREKTSGD